MLGKEKVLLAIIVIVVVFLWTIQMETSSSSCIFIFKDWKEIVYH